MKGGARPGAGRKPALVSHRKAYLPPVAWRPDNQAQLDKYRAMGGVKWLKAMINASYHTGPAREINSVLRCPLADDPNQKFTQATQAVPSEPSMTSSGSLDT